MLAVDTWRECVRQAGEMWTWACPSAFSSLHKKVTEMLWERISAFLGEISKDTLVSLPGGTGLRGWKGRWGMESKTAWLASFKIWVKTLDHFNHIHTSHTHTNTLHSSLQPHMEIPAVWHNPHINEYHYTNCTISSIASYNQYSVMTLPPNTAPC